MRDRRHGTAAPCCERCVENATRRDRNARSARFMRRGKTRAGCVARPPSRGGLPGRHHEWTRNARSSCTPITIAARRFATGRRNGAVRIAGRRHEHQPAATVIASVSTKRDDRLERRRPVRFVLSEAVRSLSDRRIGTGPATVLHAPTRRDDRMRIGAIKPHVLPCVSVRGRAPHCLAVLLTNADHHPHRDPQAHRHKKNRACRAGWFDDRCYGNGAQTITASSASSVSHSDSGRSCSFRFRPSPPRSTTMKSLTSPNAISG